MTKEQSGYCEVYFKKQSRKIVRPFVFPRNFADFKGVDIEDRSCVKVARRPVDGNHGQKDNPHLTMSRMHLAHARSWWTHFLEASIARNLMVIAAFSRQRPR